MYLAHLELGEYTSICLFLDGLDFSSLRGMRVTVYNVYINIVNIQSCGSITDCYTHTVNMLSFVLQIF